MFQPEGGGGGGEVADEGDWYAALVAGEHIGDWLDVVKVRAHPIKRKPLHV